MNNAPLLDDTLLPFGMWNIKASAQLAQLIVGSKTEKDS